MSDLYQREAAIYHENLDLKKSDLSQDVLQPVSCYSNPLIHEIK